MQAEFLRAVRFPIDRHQKCNNISNACSVRHCAGVTSSPWPVTTMSLTIDVTIREFSLVVRKATKLKLQREAQLPSAQAFMRAFHLVLLGLLCTQSHMCHTPMRCELKNDKAIVKFLEALDHRIVPRPSVMC